MSVQGATSTPAFGAMATPGAGAANAIAGIQAWVEKKTKDFLVYTGIGLALVLFVYFITTWLKVYKPKPTRKETMVDFLEYLDDVADMAQSVEQFHPLLALLGIPSAWIDSIFIWVSKISDFIQGLRGLTVWAKLGKKIKNRKARS